MLVLGTLGFTRHLLAGLMRMVRRRLVAVVAGRLLNLIWTNSNHARRGASRGIERRQRNHHGDDSDPVCSLGHNIFSLAQSSADAHTALACFDEAGISGTFTT